jgi:hypothetical protein
LGLAEAHEHLYWHLHPHIRECKTSVPLRTFFRGDPQPRGATAIPVEKRDAFLRMLAGGRADIGAGELHRLCIDVRRRITPWTTTMAARLR